MAEPAAQARSHRPDAVLVVCPDCDTVQREPELSTGNRARCRRCNRVLFTSSAGAMTRIVMMAATALVLLISGVAFPFLEIRAGGIVKRASLIDTALAYSDGLLAPLTLALAALIIVIPLLRFLFILYALAPMALAWTPARYAGQAFRWAEALKPWAMAEVFLIGAAVALVKVHDLAEVVLGPAFWALGVLVGVTVLHDSLMCRFTVWKTLEIRRPT